MLKENKIAYLAPEIPALSATFIYNEILHLEKINFDITPISVHYPSSPAVGNGVTALSKKTYYFYNDSKVSFLFANLKILFKHPLKYFRILFMAVKDSFKTGILSHTGLGILYRFLVASRLAEIITRNGCRHLHTHFAHIPADIAMYASGISGIPFSFTSHANDLFERGWLLKEKVERAKFAATISEYNARFLANQGAPQNKIHVIHCGVDIESFYRKADQEINKVPRIGSIGRMVEKKGFEILISACELLKKDSRSFHLEIVGSGPLFEKLQREITDKDLTDIISLIGSLPHKQITDWLKEKDIFVLPCKKDKHGDMDGIPVVLMEAMAMGVPVISSNISGIPELIEDGVTGLLINEGDSEGLSRAILKIITDTDLRENISRNGIKKIKDEFDLSKNTRKLSNLF